MKEFIKKHYKGLLVTFGLLIFIGGFAVKKNNEDAERKEAIRVEHVKKVEYKIAKDFADHYAGVKKLNLIIILLYQWDMLFSQ
ncbi:hypothetical protein [Fructilactobacillus florum]|uniref:Uncharacterized protein n=1 Tax=Fructilactobacillus florum DSM 22689 = JCM 16035 TaxID=1423745 RepID=A0A0R2CDQ7_9LACO|nr:hypothetical protein [Fructilactobacillus florum]KRM89832.1 hypothetical protein FC87_GL000315 [Fructilactobacillus florum DSM 22689 = JCM 16035]